MPPMVELLAKLMSEERRPIEFEFIAVVANWICQRRLIMSW